MGNRNIYTTKDIVKKLIGDIRPVGETNEDNRRFENLKEFTVLVNEMFDEIYDVAHDFQDSHEYSVKRASDFASEYIKTALGIY